MPDVGMHQWPAILRRHQESGVCMGVLAKVRWEINFALALAYG
jgi:hypothetical protein